MSNIVEEINAIIKEAVEENDGENNVTQLNFSEKQLDIGKLTPAMKTAIEQCPTVDFLGMSDCKLNSLDNLPNLPKLDTIDLKDNDLDDNEVKKLRDFKNLKNLYLEGNNVQHLETLEELAKSLPQLATLEISNNPVSQTSGFEAKIWAAFTNLEVLNQHYQNGNKVEENAGDDEEDVEESEEDYDGEEESEDSEFSEGDYDSENEKPKKKRKTK